MTNPTLPGRKVKTGAKRVAATVPGAAAQLPIMHAQELELEDGSRIPVKIPEGMPPQQAEALLTYLRANPDAAKQIHQQAQEMMKNPAMAQAYLNMQATAAQPGMAERYQALKDDPDLKHVFDDVVANGPSAFQQYWDDVDLMAKISAKMRSMSVEPAGAQPTPAAAPAKQLTSLHDAARAGDVGVLERLLGAGHAIDGKDARGVTPLGLAVGLNRVQAVQFLLDQGAAVDARDLQDNTALHYAAGYGRQEIVEVLLKAGADINARNARGQTPCAAAAMNKEVAIVQLLTRQMMAAPSPSQDSARTAAGAVAQAEGAAAVEAAPSHAESEECSLHESDSGDSQAGGNV